MNQWVTSGVSTSPSQLVEMTVSSGSLGFHRRNAAPSAVPRLLRPSGASVASQASDGASAVISLEKMTGEQKHLWSSLGVPYASFVTHQTMIALRHNQGWLTSNPPDMAACVQASSLGMTTPQAPNQPQAFFGDSKAQGAPPFQKKLDHEPPRLG